MSLPRYSEYKDSGVAWLGEVPGHWDVVPLKQVIAQIESGVSVNATDDPATENELGVLKTSCVYSGEFDVNENKTVIDAERERVSCPLKTATLIVSRMNTPELVGAAGLVKTAPQNIYLPDRLWQVSFSRAFPAFVHYWTQSNYYRAQIRVACAGTSSSMQNLGQDQFRSFSFPKPSQTEQQTITAFLDRETGKIDALIAEQRRLVELLAEKRQAVISHAVTKGLNPNALMKDSGIEWLGEVPEHWEVKKIKFLLARDGYKAGPFGSSLITSELSEEGNILVLTPEHVANESLDLPFNQYLDDSRRDEMSAFFVDLNDIVFPIVGTLGRAMIISVPRPGILNQRLARMSADITKLLPAYLKLILTDVDFYKKLDEIESKGAILNHITKEKLIHRPVLLPPTKEQKEILSFLNTETVKFDTLTAEANRAIALLQERRSALISAAVTGKIDVRGLESQKEAA